jgi:hypothetical protein
MLKHISTYSFSLLRWPLALTSIALAGCVATAPTAKLNFDPEEFDSTTTHTRVYAATEAQTCEAARRALLSQGYLVNVATPELVTGRKSFQPEAEIHVEFEFRVVCAREGRSPGSTIAFASALQDRYSLKKTNTSASLGVGVLGSVSLPVSASHDAMVKVASETITDPRFYERFFALIDRYRVFSERADRREDATSRAAPAPDPATSVADGSPR